MKSIRLTFIYLIAFMFLTAGAFALAGESGAAPSYVYIIDDTRPAANAPEAAAYVDELSKLIAILGGEDDGETAFELRALSDPQNKAYSFTAERFNPDELLYWLDEAAGSVYADAPDTAFIDALKADSFVIWVMPQTDEAQLMDNYLMQENHVSQRKTDADDVAQSSFDEAMDLYSQGLEKINAFDEAIRNDDRLLVSDSFGADEAFDAALSIMSHGQREGFGSYKGGFVTGEGLDAENIQEYFIVSNRPFSVDGETAEALFGGVHYAYVSLGGVNIEGDSESAFAVITKTAELRLIQFESRQEPYRWGETVEAVYHIDGQDGTVSAEGWKAYAVVSGGDGAVNALIDCEVQGEEISFEYAPNEFGAYSYTVHALNTLTGDELTADEAAFSVENEAPVLSAADGVIMRLDASALPAGQAQSVDLNAYYTDDRDISTLSYYVGGEPVIGGVYTVDPGDYKQDAELSVRAVDTSGAENTQGRIIVTYHHANELARMINSGANAEIQNIGWEDDRELELRSDIELTDEGRRISAAGEGDVWQAEANIYKDGALVDTVELNLASSAGGHWTYTSLYEINAYGSYSISYTACVRDMEGEALEGRSESYGLNNEPPQLKAQNGNIATLKAAGLIYEEETYSFDLRDYYSDDRDGEYLTYEFRSKDGEEYTSRSDYAEIDGNVITFKPENLTSSFSVQIRATDAEGEQNDEGYFEIQYTPVSEAASLKPLAFEKNTNDIAYIAWQERRLSLTYAISLTEAGQSLPAKDTGDIWLVEAKVYAGEQLVDTLRLEMVSGINGQWTYGTEYELGNYGGYTVICTASMAGARDQQLAPVKTDFNVFNTAPALADAYEGRIATVKAAGLMYQNENYKFDLNAYYTDDRDASSLDYEFMLDDGSYTKGGAEDFAEINGSTIEFRNEKIHGPLTVKIRATDSLGEQNDEGCFEIQYRPADELAEIYLRSPSATDEFKWQEELFEIRCEIRLKDEFNQSVFYNKQTDWSVEYSVKLKDAAQDAPNYHKLSSYSDTSSGHKGTVTTDIITEPGTYVVHLVATNNDTGAVLEKDVTVVIKDEPPQLVAEKLENTDGIIKTFFATALDPNHTDEIDLTENYFDRKDNGEGKELSFSAANPSNQYPIEDGRIRIYTNRFNKNQIININAEDSSKQVNSDGRIQVVYIDFTSFLQQYNGRKISLKAEGDDSYVRSDTIEYDVSYDIPRSATVDIDTDGVTVSEAQVKEAVNELYPQYVGTVTAEYTIYFLGADGEAASNGREINGGSLNVGHGDKKLTINPSKSLKQDGETVKAGTYVIKLTLYGGLGTNRPVISECEKRFVIKNTVPYDKGAIPGSFEHTIPWKGSERAEDDRIFIDLKELASVEPDEKITFTVNMEASGKEDVYRLYRLPEGGYLLSAAAVEDATPVQDNRLVWATGDKNASYGLYADAAGHGRKSLTVKVSDDDNAGFEKEITLTTLYRYEKEIIIAALALIALIALLLLYKLIRYLLKPAFSENDLIKVTYNGRDTRFRLQSWKKSGITLREIMIYAGVAFAGDISLKDCDDIVFMPAKGKNDFAVKLAKNKGPVLIMGGAEQSAGFKVPEGTAVTVKLNSEESMNIVRVSQ